MKLLRGLLPAIAAGLFVCAIICTQAAPRSQINLSGAHNVARHTAEMCAMRTPDIAGDSLLRESNEMLRHLRKGLGDTTLAGRLRALGEFRFGRGDFPEARRLLAGAVERYRRAKGMQARIQLARSLAGLGRCFTESGRYAEADSSLEESLRLCRALRLHIDRHEFAAVLRAAARAVYDLGDDTKAVIRYNDALAMRRRLAAGRDTPELEESLLDLGDFHRVRGAYVRADTLLHEALAMARRIDAGRDHPELLRCLIAVAVYHEERGDSARAASTFVEASAMLDRMRVHDASGRLIAPVIDLGLLSMARGDTDRARARLLEAVDTLRHRDVNAATFDLARAHSTLGSIALEQGDLAAAKPWLDRATRMYARLCGDRDHPGRAIHECVRAAYVAGRHRWKQADAFFADAAAMLHRLYERKGPLDLALGVERIAKLAERWGMNDRAAIAYRDVLETLPRATRESVAFEGEDEQIRFRRHLSGTAASLARFFLARGATAELCELSIWSKGRVLAAVEWRNRVLASLRATDPAIADAWDRYVDLRRALGRVVPDSSGGPEGQGVGFDQWAARHEDMVALAERIEGWLVMRSAAVKTGRREITWKGIARALHAGECAVEFMRVANECAADSTIYYALVLRPRPSAPVLVRLCDEVRLAGLLRAQVAAPMHDVRSYVHDARCGAELHRALWMPLDSLLHGRHRIYLSPDGLLNRVSFSALLDTSGQRLLDRFDLRYLFSARDLVPEPRIVGPRNSPVSAAVFGNVEYNCDSAGLRRAQAEQAPIADTGSASLQAPIDDRRPEHDEQADAPVEVPLAPLDASRGEVAYVQDLLAGHGYDVVVDTGVQATEKAFLRLRSPTVLHVATHGYFLTDPDLPRDQRRRMQMAGGLRALRCAENPLMRSGLLLAGANCARTRRDPPDDVEDGIVTAYDVANMDLAATELVVLSACESGLGDILAGEGVLGLKRSFRAAGARAVLMSLWKVPDKQTRELMQHFYANWLDEKMEIGNALNEAQREMAKEYDDPYYWAAFVVVGK